MRDAPEDAKTVPVRVQVIDLQPRIVDLVVPTFMPADDLTQRIARDAGLGGWWEGGRRRTYWLRARGRVLADDERLADVGVVPYELLHLLPEPASEEDVMERGAGIPDTVPLSRLSKLGRVSTALAWLGLWLLASGVDPQPWGLWWGAFVLVVLIRGAVDGLWSTQSRWGPLAATMALGGVLSVPVLANLYVGVGLGTELLVLGGMAALGGSVGLAIGHLVWMGPVAAVSRGDDPLLGSQPEETDLPSCVVCQEEIGREVLAFCRYGCGRVMHSGCRKVREAVASGSGCEVCGEAVL